MKSQPKKPSKAELEAIANLSEDEKQSLLQFAQENPEIQKELDGNLDEKVTNAFDSRAKKARHWFDNAEILRRMDLLCRKLMGPESPYQFFLYTDFYLEYKKWQEELDEYAHALSRPDGKIWIRKWLWQYAPEWEEKSEVKRNYVYPVYPNGRIGNNMMGYGKRVLLYKREEMKSIDPDTMWSPVKDPFKW
jgi:hypothetical protein